jgi:hypothetical protein
VAGLEGGLTQPDYVIFFSHSSAPADIPAMGIVAEIREVNAFTSLHTYFTAEAKYLFAMLSQSAKVLPNGLPISPKSREGCINVSQFFLLRA